MPFDFYRGRFVSKRRFSYSISPLSCNGNAWKRTRLRRDKNWITCCSELLDAWPQLSQWKTKVKKSWKTYRGAAIWQGGHADWSAHLVRRRKWWRGGAPLLQAILSLQKVPPGVLDAVNQISLWSAVKNEQNVIKHYNKVQHTGWGYLIRT